jgi:leucyl aminopeptidase
VGIGQEAPSERLLEDIGGLVGQAGVPAQHRASSCCGPSRCPQAGAHLAFGAALGQYTFRQYRTPKPDAPTLGKGELALPRRRCGCRAAWESQGRPWPTASASRATWSANRAMSSTRRVSSSAPAPPSRACDKVRIEVLDEADMASWA